MKTEFVDLQDRQNPLNGSIVDRGSHLSAVLDELQARPPFFCELRGQNGYKVLLGIGGPKGCIQYSRIDGEPPYLMAVARDLEISNEDISFLAGGTLTPVSARYCVPFETLKEVATYFQTTGERSPTVSWDEI